MSSQPSPVDPKLVLWIVWVGFFSGVLLLGVALPWQVVSGVHSGVAYALLIPGIASILIRLIGLPKAVQPERRLVFFVVGGALGECTALLGKFLVSGHEAFVLYGFGLVCVLGYCPGFLRERREA